MRLKSYLGLAAVALPTAAWGQGLVSFSNVGPGLNAPVSLASNGELLGEGWWAQLRAGADESGLALVGTPVGFTANGLFVGGVVVADGVPQGETGFFQVAVWQGPADSLAAAQADGALWGESNVFSVETGGLALPGLPPSTPATLVGLEPFEIVEPTEAAQLGDRVWGDLNGNGLQDEGEIGVAEITIRFLDCATNEVLATVVTDSQGAYQFPGDIPETSYLEVDVPSGLALSPWLVGDDASLDSNVDPLTGRSQCISANCADEDIVCLGDHIDIGLVPVEIELPVPGNPGVPVDPEGEEMDPRTGVVGAGFWKRHPSAWPVESVTIGGVEYSVSEALPLISNGSDKSLTLFRHLLAATLNVAAGNESSCIEEVLAQANDWLATHGPVPGGVAPNSEAWRTGAPLARELEAYNEGEACAGAQSESVSPVEMAVGFASGGNGPDREFRVRVKGQPGRQFILQKTEDFMTWEDVAVIDNAFGISEAVTTARELEPNAFFRVVPQRGPAKRPQPKQNKVGVFRQVGQGQTVELEPIVYEGDLVVTGANNTVTGVVLGPDQYTVIAGNLEVRGNRNRVSQLTVLGDIVIRGNNNELSDIDYDGEVIQTGGPGNNLF